MSSPSTIEQSTVAKILEKLKKNDVNPRTTFLVDPNTSPRRLKKQRGIADEAIKDTTVPQRKRETIPTNFTTNDAALVIYGSKEWMNSSGVTEKLNRANSRVRTIISYGHQIPEEEGIEDFELVETDRVVVGTGKKREQETIQVFERRKVRI